MTGTPTVAETSLPGLRLARRGKVRDVYEVDEQHLLVVATDVMSAFDSALPTQIERKGQVLTALSAFWFARLAHITPHHLVTTDVNAMPEAVRASAEVLRGRSMFVRRTEVFPVECVVRGYLAGSGWKDYLATGEVCGHRLPEGLQESAKLPAPIFTPATKAESGHDENISEERMSEIVGHEATEHLRNTALALYHEAEQSGGGRGIIIADTNFELGRDREGHIIFIDGARPPDPSRFWPAKAKE